MSKFKNTHLVNPHYRNSLNNLATKANLFFKIDSPILRCCNNQFLLQKLNKARLRDLYTIEGICTSCGEAHRFIRLEPDDFELYELTDRHCFGVLYGK